MSQIQQNQEAEPTNQDILDAINGFANHTELRFTAIEGDIKHIKNVMVTKDYLDEKMAKQKGEMIALTRREDTKVVTLIQNLHSNKVISDETSKRILSLEPFPQ